MRWLLVVIVANTPIKTDLIFDKFDACMAAEATAASQFVDIAERTALWHAKNNSSEQRAQADVNSLAQKIYYGTCIPTR